MSGNFPEALVTRRRQLIEMRAMAMARRKLAPRDVRPSIEKLIAFLSKQIEETDRADHAHPDALDMACQGRATPVGQWRRMRRYHHASRAGPLDGKQIAALVGIAPFNNDSGRINDRRSIWGGRAAVRSVLYMASVVAKTHNPVQRAALYGRLAARGKEPKVALAACMRKLVTMLNAMQRDQRA
ncbi:transposase [Sorangium sp. So ce145]|uniref:transposase n=1 Tax=Sorangium sp. So ce145 TaxID=3133285 RepID=UPI003F6031C6